eukprot:TRINITY_DN4413_c0_g1_i1.p1 TRINITY_DN4413_c0_g1~~TRINITY_DN4413_c0_g1_i1.p1  ORF type:complete len:206 (-),score=14.15 TRINITY_DN4413_c0_g1_i1:10-627(-)
MWSNNHFSPTDNLPDPQELDGHLAFPQYPCFITHPTIENQFFPYPPSSFFYSSPNPFFNKNSHGAYTQPNFPEFHPFSSSDFSPFVPSEPLSNPSSPSGSQGSAEAPFKEEPKYNDNSNEQRGSKGSNRKIRIDRFHWDEDLHRCFELAVAILGDKEVTAKKILHQMNLLGADVSRLTRIRVANHLQHYTNSKNKQMVASKVSKK